jgi:hypothetical protein
MFITKRATAKRSRANAQPPITNMPMKRKIGYHTNEVDAVSEARNRMVNMSMNDR